MQLKQRLKRIERSIGLRTDGTTACAACRDAPGKWVPVFRNRQPDRPGIDEPDLPPQSSPCHRCGRDTNNYIEVVYVDRLPKRESA